MEQGARPKLRPVEALPLEVGGKKYIVLKDPLRLTGKELFLPLETGFFLNLLDGSNTVLDLKAEYMRQTGYMLLDDKLDQLLEALDQNLMLDNQRFRQALKELEDSFRQSSVRPPFHAGLSYPRDPQELKALIDGFYIHQKGPGKLPEASPEPAATALVAPHIDVNSGGPTFAWAYHALAQGTPPDRFVILGTGHQGAENLFCLTAKDFETPLGMVKTDQTFLEALTKGTSRDHFKDEFLHRNEHTIEFQLIFLQHLYGPRTAYTMVPILCSFDPEMFFRAQFQDKKSVFDQFTRNLAQAIKHSPGKTCLIASIDLDHIGPRYGDSFRPDQSTIKESLEGDRELLSYAGRLQERQFLEKARVLNPRKKICGFAPLYTLITVLGSGQGRLLHLDYTVVDQLNSFVTFAAMIFR